jgi:acyl-CoA synthetase (AMP-forming)/AMP-acid ligase II
VLGRHPAVAEVVVLARTDDDGTVSLHACYTGTAVADEELTALLRDLPDYMRPQSYHHRDALPVNLNGKVDRRRLAAEIDA